MKIPAILTCLLAVLLAAVPVRNARADDVSFDVFYNNLADDGDWYNTPEYGYVWQPSVAYKSDKWRPYTDGYWAQTDDGWTWVSYENFGWATYHYGRWTRLKDTGWVWVPGYDWGPGWVSWRTSDDYVGWAPLPPKAEQGVYEGRIVDRPDRGPATTIDYNDVEPEDYGADVDVQYDIGPENYCFVDTHNFGAPVLGEVLLPPQRNVVIIERTVNVTNIYRQRGNDRFVVYNRGPDFNFISAHSERPIQQLRLERHDNLPFLTQGIRGGGNANQVRNGVYSVAAPMVTRGPINLAQVRPARVKGNLDRSQVVHGWSNSGADSATTQRLREQFKQQAQQAPPPRRDAAASRDNEPARGREARNIPPAPAPDRQPFNAPGVGAPVTNPAVVGPQQPRTDAEKAARRDARQKARAAGQPIPTPGQPAVAPERDARPGPVPVAPNAGATAPAASGDGGQTLTPEERNARKAARQQARGQEVPPGTGAPPVVNGGSQPVQVPAANPDRDARRAQRQQEKAPQVAPAPERAQPAAPPQSQAAPSDPERDARRAQRQQERAQQPAPAPQPQPAAPNPERDARRAQRPPEQAAPQRAPQPAQPQAPAQNPDREARRAERQQEQGRAPQDGKAHQPTGTPDPKKPNQ